MSNPQKWHSGICFVLKPLQSTSSLSLILYENSCSPGSLYTGDDSPIKLPSGWSAPSQGASLAPSLLQEHHVFPGHEVGSDQGRRALSPLYVGDSTLAIGGIVPGEGDRRVGVPRVISAPSLRSVHANSSCAMYLLLQDVLLPLTTVQCGKRSLRHDLENQHPVSSAPHRTPDHFKAVHNLLPEAVAGGQIADKFTKRVKNMIGAGLSDDQVGN